MVAVDSGGHESFELHLYESRLKHKALPQVQWSACPFLIQIS